MAVPNFEVVYLVSDTMLADAHDTLCEYQTPAGKRLRTGRHYVVERPEAIKAQCFDASAHYYGPYPSELAAYIKLEERRAVLLWEEGAATLANGTY